MSDNLHSSTICKCCAESHRSNGLLEEPNFVSALKKLLEQLLPLMMVANVGPVLVPMMQSLVQNTMGRGLDSLLEKLNARTEWKAQASVPRKLALKFSDTVSSPVYTGKDIRGIGGNSIRVALVDAGGKTMNSGVEASSKVEIMVLADGESIAETEAEKTQTMPLLSKNYFNLKEGVAVLDNIKFKSEPKWTKQCKVKLVARILGNNQESTVEVAETESFVVCDIRATCYKNSDIPSLSDNVWRLKMIHREGELHKRLRDAKIETVEELLVSVNTDPQSLQQGLNISPRKFKVILDHAQKCKIPADRYIYHCTGCEGYTAVVFDVVGRVLGLVLHEDQRLIPANDLNEDEKVDAQRMVKSAFAQRKDIQPYDTEPSTSDHDFSSRAANEDADHSFSQFAELGWHEILRLMGGSPNRLCREDLAGSEAIWEECKRSLRISPQCSELAKGRWKRAVMFLKSMSKGKRIVAPDEETHAQKRQKCG